MTEQPQKTPERAAETNRLAQETSPYLLQHAGNPVNWYPWGDEAFAKARDEDKPLFLSIGYSACHWCHVMERESFESPEIAAILNRHFVAVKVDREERPDVDSLYMRAVQMMTGSGGWPMSVFLTPDLEPFYGGTYFPPEDRYGQPGFRRVLLELARMWRDERERLLQNSTKILAVLKGTTPADSAATDLDPKVLTGSADQLVAAFDHEHGGFGSAPKFPPSMALRFLLQRHARSGRGDLLDVVKHTLNHMAAGGIHDQLGGGFHRYSVDELWLVPHFEKMLYDNALLAVTYLEAAQLTGDPAYGDIAEGCLEFLLRDMQDDGGAFHATLDADSEGEEGLHYLWTREQILDHLGPEDGDLFCQLYGVTGKGNFEGATILHLAGDPQRVRREHGLTEEAFAEKVTDLKARLLALRSERPWPHKDDKILTSWNGLALSAFARAAGFTSDPRYLGAARSLVGFIQGEMMPDGELIHTWRLGTPGAPANLDDYAYLARGLLDLYQVDGSRDTLCLARELADTLVERFGGDGVGTFYYTDAQRNHLISRERCDADAAVPSPAGVAAEVMYLLGRMCDDESRTRSARSWATQRDDAMKRSPLAHMTALRLADAIIAAPVDVIIAGALADEASQRLLSAAHSHYLPAALRIPYDPSSAQAEAIAEAVPMVAGRHPVDGAPAAYVCRNRTCGAPVTTPAALHDLLEDCTP